MKRALIAIAVLVSSLLGQAASAHVLVTDDTKAKGAILHIIPDDDPVAGESATLFFDTQDKLLNGNNTKVTLTVRQPDEEKKSLAMTVAGTLATVDYVFPVQGVYNLTFLAESNDKSYTFEWSQRVSRGVMGSALDVPRYTWAEMLVVSACVGLILLVIIAFNRRKVIAKQSVF